MDDRDATLARIQAKAEALAAAHVRPTVRRTEALANRPCSVPGCDRPGALYMRGWLCPGGHGPAQHTPGPPTRPSPDTSTWPLTYGTVTDPTVVPPHVADAWARLRAHAANLERAR